MPGYVVEGLGKAYRDARGQPVAALDDLSLQVAAGELLVVLGPSGSGKTTLLRCVAGLEKPDAGRVLEEPAAPQGAEGTAPRTDLAGRAPHARDMAMVFQDFSLYPRMTVGENLAFPLQAKALALPKAEAESRVREAAAFLGLADKLDRRPHELSGGERQRVALGRALVRRPKLFLLDEPLVHLDAKLRERMILEIRRLQRSLKAALIYATRDPGEAMVLADRVVALDCGKALQAGTPEDVYRHPADSRVAHMLGRPSINVLSAADAGRLGLPAEGSGRLVGVRPESWRVTPDPAGPALVKGVEHLGPRAAVILDVGGISLRALAAPSLRLRAGDRVRLGVDPSEVHSFER